MRCKLIFYSCMLLIGLPAMGQVAETDTTSASDLVYFNREIPITSDKELTFIAYFFSQGVNSNYFPRSDFFQGQVIGRLFGRSTARTSDTLRTSFVEQRFLPFFIYTPKLMDGKVTLRGSFEIDWTWGDAAYGSGGNQGAGFNADFVNIQTQNIEVEINPAPGYAINFGLMRTFDSPYHPYRTTVDKLMDTGYRLMYWAGDAAGISFRHDFARGNVSAGLFNLWENRIELQDDVWLYKAMGMYKPLPGLNIGGSVYHINDKSNGRGGASILGQGPKSLLTEYTGAYRFSFSDETFETNVTWLGTFWDYNRLYTYHSHKFAGFFNYNTGNIQGEEAQVSTINGFGLNLRYGFRYGNTPDDEITADYIYTTGDDDFNDDEYTGVITGNTWGAPGNLPVGIGTNILFPSGNVVNRYMPLVGDISNMGAGLNALNVQVKKAIIPHKWILSANGAYAMSNEPLSRGGTEIGLEANLGVTWKIKTLMEIELRAAHVWLGDFYDAPYANGDQFIDAEMRLNERPVNPWTAFVAFKWLMF
ncbi:MAG: hypothetical protein ABR574_02070 [Cryomorphaceae bacterium]